MLPSDGLLHQVSHGARRSPLLATMPIYDSSRNKEPPISNHAVHDRATARSLERHHQRLRTIAQQNIRPYNVGDGWSHSKPRYEHLTHNLKFLGLRNQ